MFEKLWLAAVITLLANLAYLSGSPSVPNGKSIPLGAEIPPVEPAYLLTQEVPLVSDGELN